MASNALGYTLGGLAGLGALLDQLDRQRRADALQEMTLAKDQGTFVPVAPGEAPPQTFLERLLGGTPTPGYYDLGGGKMYRLQPYPELGEEGARALGLTSTDTQTYAPMQALPLSDTPVGPALPNLPTAASITTDTVPTAIARLRMDPKTVASLTLEQIKDNARLKRQTAVEAIRTERRRLALDKDPAGVARLKWVAEGIASDDDDVRSVAEAELERMQAPSDRVDLGRDRLTQAYKIHLEKLDARADEVDQRLEAARLRGDQREQIAAARDRAALERQRERATQKLDELGMVEGGRDYRRELSATARQGTGTGESAEMTTADADARLKELRTSPYFPGQASDKLTILESLVAKFKAEGRSHVGPVISKRIERLTQQLSNATRREGGRGPSQALQSPAPAPGRQSSATPFCVKLTRVGYGSCSFMYHRDIPSM